MAKVLEEEIREIIDGHCCLGCDGYGCPNDGDGNNTGEITQKIMRVIQELR